ncbi:MAG: DUF4878 domain-containing protein [Bacteroidales bacterium]|nr:DUF4878 domain-containing protein [Bacteroidales bacterium]
MKKLFFSLACVIALFATTACGGGASTPADAAAECIELLKDKDYEGFVETIKMGENVTPEEAKQAKEMYVSMLKEKGDAQFNEKQGIASYTLVSEEIAEDGTTAKVVYEVTYGDGSTDKQSFNMVNADGKWMQDLNK